MNLKEKYLIKIKDIQHKQHDLALRCVRNYIHICMFWKQIVFFKILVVIDLANVISDGYINSNKDNENLEALCRYTNRIIELNHIILNYFLFLLVMTCEILENLISMTRLFVLVRFLSSLIKLFAVQKMK